MEIVKLKPSTKDYIWGGTKLIKWGKEAISDIIAETWELSFNEHGLTSVATGPLKGQLLKDVVTKEDLGNKCDKFPFFPLLVKIIDSADNLSIQVHPSDEYAIKNENSFGKTEMWYIMECEEDAFLYLGFNKDTSKKEVMERINNNTILDILNKQSVKPGETYFIEAGTIHAIGKGITLCEIQQNSDLTYRVYDYDRKDKQGNKRPLHINKAMDVLNFKKYQKVANSQGFLGKCEYFEVSKHINKNCEIVSAKEDCFSAIVIIDGKGSFANIPYKKGDAFFIPTNKKGTLVGECKYLYISL